LSRFVSGILFGLPALISGKRFPIDLPIYPFSVRLPRSDTVIGDNRPDGQQMAQCSLDLMFNGLPDPDPPASFQQSESLPNPDSAGATDFFLFAIPVNSGLPSTEGPL
jgi:hypothetical protein